MNGQRGCNIKIRNAKVVLLAKHLPKNVRELQMQAMQYTFVKSIIVLQWVKGGLYIDRLWQYIKAIRSYHHL